MRISCRRDDPGFQTLKEIKSAGKRPEITLFGASLRDVVTADEEQGIVDKFLRDERGNVLTNGNITAVFRLRGKVQIKVK